VNITPTLMEYDRILDFSNNNHNIYFRQRLKNTAYEVVRLLYLGKISQYRVVNERFKWKVIEAKMKKNVQGRKTMKGTIQASSLCHIWFSFVPI